jgi:hypothetical protein
MEIDAKEFKETITYVFEKFRNLETEILAYAMTIRVPEKAGLIEQGLPWNATMTSSRQHPLLVKTMADKYDPLIADLMQAIDRSDPVQALSEWFRKWKPSGAIN